MNDLPPPLKQSLEESLLTNSFLGWSCRHTSSLQIYYKLLVMPKNAEKSKETCIRCYNNTAVSFLTTIHQRSPPTDAIWSPYPSLRYLFVDGAMVQLQLCMRNFHISGYEWRRNPTLCRDLRIKQEIRETDVICDCQLLGIRAWT